MLFFRKYCLSLVLAVVVFIIFLPCRVRGAEVRIVGPVDVEEIAVTLARGYAEYKGYVADGFTLDSVEEQCIFN